MPLLIVEDRLKFARNYYNLLQDNNVPEVLEIACNPKEARVFIQGENPPNQYIVDIDLEDKRTGGIEVLRNIKDKCPDSLVIAYTAHDMEKECRKVDLPHFHFFDKADVDPQEHFRAFSSLIAEYNKNMKVDAPDHFVAYYAQIAHIDKDEPLVKLMCYYEDDVLGRFYHAEPIRAALGTDFGINKWVKVAVVERGPEIKILFTKPGRIPLDVTEVITSKISDEDFAKSQMWQEPKRND